jgi:hypothetical protein
LAARVIRLKPASTTWRSSSVKYLRHPCFVCICGVWQVFAFAGMAALSAWFLAN